MQWKRLSKQQIDALGHLFENPRTQILRTLAEDNEMTHLPWSLNRRKRCYGVECREK